MQSPGTRRGRWFEAYLEARDWASGYGSIQRLLDHLARKTKSESSRRHHLETVASLCKREKKNPDQLVGLRKPEAEGAVQSYLDQMTKLGRSLRYVDVSLAQLVTFFRVNGFKRNVV